MQERKQYKISLPMTEKQKNKVEELLKFASFDGTPFRLEEIENTEEVQEEKEWPQDGEVYYYIHSDGGISCSNFYLNDSFCKNILSIGNCFRTREEAEFELERLKVIEEMKKFAESEDREWNRKHEHWYLYYDFERSCIQYNYNRMIKSNNICFESLEQAKQCIETIGKDRIRKYYLQIKE